MKENIIFISYFSEENLELGRFLCKEGEFSCFLLWQNDLLLKSKSDFNSLMSNTNIKEDGYVLKYDPQNDFFATELMNFINDLPFEPDHIIVKGTLSQVWPISIMKESVLIETSCSVILEDLTNPLEDFEKKSLNSFDNIFPMGGFGVPVEHLNKTTYLFPEDFWFKPALYQSIPDYSDIPKLDNTLLCCNSSNFKELCEDIRINKEKTNIIDIEEAEEDELSVCMTLCERVVNYTDYEKFDFLIKKVGKNPIKFEKFIDRDFNENSYFSNAGMLEDFIRFIGNKILENITFIKGNKIRGLEIT